MAGSGISGHHLAVARSVPERFQDLTLAVSEDGVLDPAQRGGIAYRLGAIHTNASIYHLENEMRVKALDAFGATTLLPTRNNIEHLLLSIAQDVCPSRDVVRFCEA